MAIRLELKPAKYNGKKGWCLDLRPFGEGRKFFAVQIQGKAFLDQKRRDLGLGWADLSDEDRIKFVAAKQRLTELGATIDEVIDFYAKHRIVGETLLMPKAVQKFLNAKAEKKCRDSYIKKLTAILNGLCVGLADTYCHQVTRQQVEAWLARDGWKGVTRKYALKDATTFFDFCIKRGWARVNPCDGVEAPIVEDKPPGILTVDECRRLIETSQRKVAEEFQVGNDPKAFVYVKPRELLGYFVIGLFCGGIRPEEIQKMTWSMVNVAERFIEVPASVAKTRKRRIVEVSENAAALLAKIKKRKGNICPPNFRRKFMAVRAAAKVNWSHDCMRHSFGSYHLAEYGSADKTATQMGHRNTDMLFAHYRELVRPNDAHEYWNIK